MRRDTQNYSPKMNVIKYYFLLFIISFSCSKTYKSNYEFERLLCEYSENPINIDVKKPRFSWLVSSAERGQYQTAYQILVGSEENTLSHGNAELWNSGKVNADATTHIAYEGSELESNTHYFWKVIVWDRQGRQHESEIARFATAFLSENDWKAKWIGANDAPEPKPDKGFFMNQKEETSYPDTVNHNGRSVLLRNEFAVDKEISSAKLYIIGLGFYEAEINGSKVGDFVLTPAKTPYHKHILYDTYDVTDYVKQGENAIGIHLGNGWYDPYKRWWQEYRMQWFGYKKALAQLHITYSDGSETIIHTDEKWKTSRGPVLFNCVYDGEIYDANKEMEEWSMPGFDDSDWKPATLMNAPKARLISHAMPAIEINEIRKPVKITEPKPAMKVYDLGQNFTGWVRLTMVGKKGTRIKIRFSEELYEDGTLNFTCNENAKATIEYVLKGGGSETYEPRFTYFGFQFVEITAEETLPEITDLKGCVIYSANETIGAFESSHDLINKMHHATVWSQKSNMLSYPMDCPQRDERLGWMGDAQVTAEEAMFNFDMALFYKNWFRGIRANQDSKTGDIPIISPRPYIRDDVVEWSSTFITMVWNNYIYYGDRLVLEENYEAMKRYIDFLGEISEGYIVPKGWIGDWGSMVAGWEEGEPESIPTAYYFFNATILQKIAKVLARKDDEQHFVTLAASIKKAYNRKYYHPSTNDYNDGSQMANAFPLYLGLVPEEDREAVLTNLIHDIEVENDTHLTTGVLGTKYLIDALSISGRPDVAWSLATQTTFPSWAEMMKRFNTMCEFWTLKQSHNHVMMGSIDAWFYKSLAGIQLIEKNPAFKQFIIKPFFAEGLDHVNASTKTIRGKVASEWVRTENGLNLRVEVPFNCTAIVHIPASEEVEILESGKTLDENEDVEAIEYKNGYRIVQIPSGNYLFSY